MNLDNFKNKTAKILLDIKAVNVQPKKPFKLTSGKLSPVYVDCRKIISHLKERRLIIDMGCKLLKKKLNLKKIDFIAGGETAGIPYAAWISEKLNKPMIYIRKKPKKFGKRSQIEGDFENNKKCILIEDLATDGKSKEIFINAMRENGLKVKDTFVIFYYNIFEKEKLELTKMGIKIHFLCSWHDILNEIKKTKILENKKIESIEKFLFKPDEWESNE